MKTLTIRVVVPDAIRGLMADAPDAPAGVIADEDVQEYVAGIVVAALALMGPTGQRLATDVRLLNERW